MIMLVRERSASWGAEVGEGAEGEGPGGTPTPGGAGGDPLDPRATALETLEREAVADPSSDLAEKPDEELEEEATTLAAHLAAAEHRFLRIIAELDRREAWKRTGDRTLADWLARHTGMAPHTARERIRVARSLETLPRISSAMAQGRLSYSQVCELRKVATEDCEASLLEVAEHATVKELQRFVASWPAGSRADEDQRARARHRARRLAVFPDDAGMVRVAGRLTAEEGALLEKALEAAEDVLYGEEGWQEELHDRRRADALVLLAERVLAAGFGRRGQAEGDGARETSAAPGPDGARETSTTPASAPDPDGARETSAAASPDGARETSPPASAPQPAPLTGTRGERYQVFVHVDLNTLQAESEPGRSELADGTRVAPETARRLTCDAALVPVHKNERGEILNVGRRQRAFPPAIRRALEVRDGGCRFPGCGLPYTVPHHVTHWAEGGETSLKNGVLLCHRHHHLVHEGGWEVHLSRDGRVAIFVDPQGRMHPSERPRPPKLPANPVKTLMADNLRRGARPDGWSLTPHHHPDRAREGWGEVPWQLQARALEAMDRAHFGDDEGEFGRTKESSE